MRFLADESIERLRSDNFSLDAIDEFAAGSPDDVVLRIAEDSRCILLTNDKDFAMLAFLQQKARQGIVLVRMPRHRAAAKAVRVAAVLLEHGNSLRHHLTVIEPRGVRRRRLPRPGAA